MWDVCYIRDYGFVPESAADTVYTLNPSKREASARYWARVADISGNTLPI